MKAEVELKLELPAEIRTALVELPDTASLAVAVVNVDAETGLEVERSHAPIKQLSAGADGPRLRAIETEQLLDAPARELLLRNGIEAERVVNLGTTRVTAAMFQPEGGL